MFRHREALNWVFCGVVFAVVSLVVAVTMSGWWAVGVAIFSGSVVAYINVSVLSSRVIKIECTKCHKILRTNTPWVCGLNKCINYNADEFPFVHKCGKCGAEPTGYRCHYPGCPEVILLTDDESQINVAFCLTPDGPKLDEQGQIMKTHAKKVQDKNNELAIAELDAKLRVISSVASEPKLKSRKEQKISAFDDDVDASVGLRAHAQMRREQIAKEHAGNKDLIDKYEEAIQAALRKHGL